MKDLSKLYKDGEKLFGIHKDGVFYRILADDCLQVARTTGMSEYWKTDKHVGYDKRYSHVSYSNIEIPEEIDGMKVVSVEAPFSYMAEIRNVKFPETIKTFGSSLNYISDVLFPSKVMDTYYECVSHCNNITIPGSVKRIGDISDCNGIVIPNSVQTIGTINSCKIIKISSSVVSIERVIGNNTVLIIDNPTPPILIDDRNSYATTMISVPKGSLEAYKNDPRWKGFWTIREDPALGTGLVLTPQQGYVDNGAAEKEIAELKNQLVKKGDELAELKLQLTQRQDENANLKRIIIKKDEEITELKRQSENNKAREESKSPPDSAQLPPTQTSTFTPSMMAVPKANRVYKLAEYKSKGKLCHTIVKTYVEQHPDVTIAQLKQVFNVPKCEVVELLSVALTIKDSSGKVGGDYYVKEGDQLNTKDGIVVVWSYWPERFFNPFVERMKAFGLIIE